MDIFWVRNLQKYFYIPYFCNMILYPPAKINIGLYVKNKRLDGFHNLESIFYSVPFCDILELNLAEKFSFTSSGLVIPGNPNDNLCVKAYFRMKELFDLPPVSIHLHKIIPMGAGIGGGSADAAFVLRGLRELFSLEISDKQLEVIAAELGSDCPFFITDQPKYVTGRGEVMDDIDFSLKGKYLAIINDGTHVSTKDAFSTLVPLDFESGLKANIDKPIQDWQTLISNDFEKSVFAIYPHLETYKKYLLENGAVYVSMSGSGSTIYGIFNEEPSLKIEDDLLVRVFKLEV